MEKVQNLQQETLNIADIASNDYPMIYILRKQYFIRGSVKNLKQWMVLKLI